MVTKILIADDHAMLRQGLRTMLEQAGHRVVAETFSGENACMLWEKFHPDMAILDLDMPGIGGLEALKRIVRKNNNAQILIFSMHDDNIYATRAFQAGARGYITKTEPPETLLEAVNKILKGGRYISQEMAQHLVMHKLDEAESPIEKLSPREFEVFRRIAEGGSLSSISNDMQMAYKTAANIQTHVKRKLEVETTGQLVHLAMRFGVVQSKG